MSFIFKIEYVSKGNNLVYDKKEYHHEQTQSKYIKVKTSPQKEQE